ncbi:SURF1 family protein [Cryobacterium psychrophilum]|uniref:SURF1-like protein n=1 Tax=Cryobacterium psychrophilum TaxID=41988 RepID=A0A4Y8KR39_9MICO|nr:SURF1 family cytochrome oxidase biogenesis protein [Cryobacterium psychrophilum]TDW29622.1 SURF1 family protein [Cryobacterium psychrophilum]TFD81745.1 SURF1 family protein [Cryobacterium psychrophilum]
MMRRPRWVLALLLALAIAAGFAVLGHWQLARAIESGVVVERSTEVVQPLTDVVQPSRASTQVSTGQMVTFEATVVPGDEQLISKRFNGDELGFWVVSHYVTTPDAAHIAVARGWSVDEAGARAVMDDLAQDAATPVTITGRFLPGEAPELPDAAGPSSVQTTVAPSALINLWANFTDQPVFTGYIVDAVAPTGLATIDSPVPEIGASLNWLNIFYAIEWVVFAGFAVFIWFRLVRDAVEREQEDVEEAEKDAAEALTSGT